MKYKNSYTYFDRILTRPGMYLGKLDVNLLFIHYQGYLLFILINNIKIHESPSFNFFNDYIAVILGYDSSISGWANMLNEYYKDPKIALDKFFEHLDDFKRDMKGKTRQEMGDFLKSKGYELHYNFSDDI